MTHSTSLTPQDFVAKWRHATLKERSASQEHFIDLCRLIGHPTPAELDPSGGTFTFEAGAEKLGGGHGWADVWYKGRFAWEYKGKHADLDKAYQQLQQYRESLQNPPLLIVSDINQIVIHTNFTNTIHRIYNISLDDLLDPSKLSILRSAFNRPADLRAPQTTDQVTQEAAAHFSRLAEILYGYGEDPPQVAHFLIRLLFCLFAEDVDLLPKDIFTNLVHRARTQPQAFAAQLRQLFSAMSTGGWFGPEKILHFNGRLFDDDTVLHLDSECMEILAEVCTLDWSSIEPSIFGTLFERSLDPSKRSQLGAHYTSKEDILLIVEPVLMAPLRRRWTEVQERAQELVDRIGIAKGGQRTKLMNRLSSLFLKFDNELSEIHVLDPACGSGNFLYVALRQLLDIEKEVITFAGSLGVGRFFPSVSPAQLHGIEINEYAHQLAQSTIWIGYIQWFNENGFGFPSQPILKPLDNILLMDAILGYDPDGNPIEPEWPESAIIISNPPFLGGNRIRMGLGDDYVEDLFVLYSDRVPATADLVCYWFEKSRKLLNDRKLKRAGLLATNSIRHSTNRFVLDRISESGSIFWAIPDMEWILDGADVRISMVAFDDGSIDKKYLNHEVVEKINSDLTSNVDVSLAKIISGNRSLSFVGIEKAGTFDINGEQAREMIDQKGNPNGLPNTDVVIQCENAIDIAKRSRDMWIVDFGTSMSLEEASNYEKPFEYIKNKVKPARDKNRRKARREKWWLFGETRPAMREAISNLNRFIVTPRVSKHRFFVWRSKSVLPLNKLLVIARDDDYFFGVLQSRLHEIWSIAKSSRHGVGNDIAYNNTNCFETFPFPWSPGQEHQDDPRVQAIAQAACELVEKRDTWLNPPGATGAELKKRTRTNLYNQRPTWLDLAHSKLDEAVFAAYGWSPDLTDDQILEHLLALNLARAANQ